MGLLTLVQRKDRAVSTSGLPLMERKSSLAVYVWKKSASSFGSRGELLFTSNSLLMAGVAAVPANVSLTDCTAVPVAVGVVDVQVVPMYRSGLLLLVRYHDQSSQWGCTVYILFLWK